MALEPPGPKEVADFRFKKLRNLQIFDYQLDLRDQYVNLLAVSNKYGLLFMGTAKGVKVIKVAAVEKVDNDKALARVDVTDYSYRQIVCERAPVHLALSCDDLTFSVCVTRGGCLHADLYDVRDFADERAPKGPFSSIRLSATPALQLLDLRWNPTATGALATCLSDGSVSTWDVGDASAKPPTISQKLLGHLPPATAARSICYSPKGKQLVVGLENGSLAQYTPDLRPVGKTTLPPPDLNAFPVVSITWLSNHQFAAVYCVDDRPCLVLVTAPPKNGTPLHCLYNDVCYGNGDQRPIQYFALHRSDWNVLLCASSNATDIAVLASSPLPGGTTVPVPGAASWEQWILEDSGRAELPLVGRDETYPLGLVMSTTAQMAIAVNDTDYLSPRPMLHVLSSGGVLCSYHVISDRADAPTPPMIPPEMLSAVGARQPALAPPPPYVAPSSGGGLFRLTSTPVPSSEISERTPFGHKLPTNVTSENSGSTVVFGTGSVKTGVPPSPAVGSIIFGTPVSSIAADTTAASTPAPPLWRPQQSVTGTSGFSPFSPGAPQSTAMPSVTITPIRPQPLAARSAGNQVVAPQPQFGFTGVVNSSASKTMDGCENNLSGFQPPIKPTSKEPVPVSEAKSPGPKLLTKSLSRKMAGGSAKTAILAALQEESRQFGEEVARSRKRAAQTHYRVGTEQEMKAVQEQLLPLEAFAEEATRTTAGLRFDVNALRVQTLDTFAAVEEARTMQSRGRDAKFLHLLGSRQLDPLSAKRMTEIRAIYITLESRLKEINIVLDRQWEEFQTEERRAKGGSKGGMPPVPSMELIYRTVMVHQRVSENLRNQVDKMAADLARISSSRKPFFRETQTLDADNSKFGRTITSPRPITSSVTFDSPKELHARQRCMTHDIASLSKSLLGFSMNSSSLMADQTKNQLSRTMSANMQQQLRSLLENRPVTRVRPPSPTDFSRLVSPTLLAAEERLRVSRLPRPGAETPGPEQDFTNVLHGEDHHVPEPVRAVLRSTPLVTSTPFASTRQQPPVEFSGPSQQQPQFTKPVAVSVNDPRSVLSTTHQSFPATPVSAPNIFSVAAAAATSRLGTVKGVTPLAPTFKLPSATPSATSSFGIPDSSAAKKTLFTVGSADQPTSSPFGFSAFCSAGTATTVPPVTKSSFVFTPPPFGPAAGSGSTALPMFNLNFGASSKTTVAATKPLLQSKYEDVTPPPSPRAKSTAVKHGYAYDDDEEGDDEEEEEEDENPEENDEEGGSDEYEDLEGEEEVEEDEEYEEGEEEEPVEGGNQNEVQPEDSDVLDERSRIILTPAKHKADSSSPTKVESARNLSTPGLPEIITLSQKVADIASPTAASTQPPAGAFSTQQPSLSAFTASPGLAAFSTSPTLTAFGAPTTAISFGGTGSIFGGTSATASSPPASAFKLSGPASSPPQSSGAASFSFVSSSASTEAASTAASPPPTTASTTLPAPVVFKPFSPTTAPPDSTTPLTSPVVTATAPDAKSPEKFPFASPSAPSATSSFFGGAQTAGATSGVPTAPVTGQSVFGTTPAFGQSSTPASPSNPANSPFGVSKTVFGAAASSFSFGQPGVSAFGSSPGSSISSAFGQTSSFSQPSVFGHTPVTSTSSIFAAAPSIVSGAFGGQPSGGFFSGLGGNASAESASRNIFGGSSTFGSSLQQSTGLFGAQSQTEQAGSSSFWNKQLGDSNVGSGSFSGGGGSISQTGFGGFQASPTKPGQHPGAFGGSAAFGSAPVFGGSPAFGSAPTTAFGKPPSEQAGFGGFVTGSFLAASNAPTFGSLAAQTSPQPSMFGEGAQQQQQQSPTIFGGAASAFGTSAPGSSPSFSQWRS